MTSEVWRPIPGADGYQASSDGRISGPRGVLKPSKMRNGYLSIKIKGRGTTAHAAVAAAFHGQRPTPAHTVNHKNGNKTDNRQDNLEWVTRSQNLRHAADVLGVKWGGKKRLPDPPPSPAPLTEWQTITVTLLVPTCGRCDQHATIIDGERVGLLSATEIGRRVAAAVRKRPSHALQADLRRDEWLEALQA